MVLSNYEDKIGHTLGVVQVDLTVGSITRPITALEAEVKTKG